MADHVLAAIDGFADQRSQIESRTVERATLALAGFSEWYEAEGVAQLVGGLSSLLIAGQTGIAHLTDAHLARTTSLVRQREVSPAGAISEAAGSLRRGAPDLPVVYARVAEEFRWQRSTGKAESEARHMASVRLSEMVSTDLGLAHRDQVARFSTVRRLTYFRRVIRGEGSCGLCAAASDRVYKRGDLLDIHTRCRCDVIEVTAKSDPGSQINDDVLQDLYATAGSKRGADLKRLRVEVFEHGELGPQLRIKGHHVQGARYQRASGRTAQSEAFQLRMLEALPPASTPAAAQWRAERIAEARRFLGSNTGLRAS